MQLPAKYRSIAIRTRDNEYPWLLEMTFLSRVVITTPSFLEDYYVPPTNQTSSALIDSEFPLKRAYNKDLYCCGGWTGDVEGGTGGTRIQAIRRCRRLGLGDGATRCGALSPLTFTGLES